MVETRRKRAREAGNSNGNNENTVIINNNNKNKKKKNNYNKRSEGGEYEKLREKRIKENMEKMQKLGIFDLSLKLKADVVPPKRNVSSSDEKKKTHIPLLVSKPSRRSSRLKTLAPVSYSEIHEKKERKSSKNKEICLREGSQPEIYTEEHEKLLGDCKTTWELSVDGYGKDGKRIYDPVKGETCHQCRQKTLGHHTHCSKCDLVQGQFCGDCLYMRKNHFGFTILSIPCFHLNKYGENVIEANQNLNWICPVCRGICNCSLCRKAKGWAPTGYLYRKVIEFGFKSVAHFLIQTRRSQPKSEDSAAESTVFAERSLDADDGSDGFPESQPEDHEDEIEEEQRKCSFSDIKYVGTDSGCKKDYNNDYAVDNDVGLKEKKEDMDEQELNNSEL